MSCLDKIQLYTKWREVHAINADDCGLSRTIMHSFYKSRNEKELLLA